VHRSRLGGIYSRGYLHKRQLSCGRFLLIVAPAEIYRNYANKADESMRVTVARLADRTPFAERSYVCAGKCATIARCERMDATDGVILPKSNWHVCESLQRRVCAQNLEEIISRRDASRDRCRRALRVA